MRGGSPFGSVEVLVRALLHEFPELDPVRLRTAVERATARAASASLDTEGHQIVHQHLPRVEASEESAERAEILRALSDDLEHNRGDADRALVVHLSAFNEAPGVADLDPLLRLARLTERWSELPLDAMTTLIDLDDAASPRRFSEIAAAWQQLGNAYRAADCLERVLLLAPADAQAHEGLEVFYRASGEWPVLLDLLARRATHVETVERAELLREMGLIYERELNDDSGARDAYQEADRLEPDRPDVLEALTRLAVRLGGLEDEALTTLERSSRMASEPKARAKVLHRAAEIARHHDYDKAQDLYERARKDDPDLVPAVDGLVVLLRDRGDLPGAITLLIEAAGRPALAGERSRWLADAADYCVAIGDTDWAKTLYRDARIADPTNHHAGLALVELCWDTGAVVELAPILAELCRTTHEPARLRGYLVQLAKVSAELGDPAAVRASLTRAVDLDRHDPITCRELAEILFENQEWAAARELIEGLLEEHEAALPEDANIELHFRIARCAREMGDNETAAKQAGITLALSPGHRPALLLRSELEAADPVALAANQLALANIAPPEEKADRFAALGDVYAGLGDVATAREMYREALVYRPTDHLLLTKSLGLVADEGDWSYSLDLVQRLVESEHDRAVRARYRHLAAMIARDNLSDRDHAVTLFEAALEDDPTLFPAADELETTLGEDREALVAFYYRRLGHVRDDEGRPGERLRLWDRLGEACLALGRHEDAVVAFEVGLSLDPDDWNRLQQLADLYVDADPKHDTDAIAHHQTLLALDKRRIASYKALRALYVRTGQPEKARACDDALMIVDSASASGGDAKLESINKDSASLDALFDSAPDPSPLAPPSEPGGRRPLSTDDWIALSRVDVDPQLSALFTLIAPPFAAERARTKPPRGIQGRDVRDRELPPAIARVLGQVVTAFGMARPAVYVDREQLVASNVVLRARDGVLAPVLVIGKPALDGTLLDRELAFVLARQLADLRVDRLARLLCPRAGELAQIVELVTAAIADAKSHSGRWLASTLHANELDRVLSIGARLRERGVDPMRAARGWRTATERAADRIGLVVAGDLATCVRMLEGQGTNVTSDVSRILELVWASVTEEVLAVRARVEGWRTRRAVDAA